GVLAPPPGLGGLSASLLALADARAATVVERAAPGIRRGRARGRRRGVVVGLGAAALGGALFVASAPAAGRAAAFWHPLRTLAAARMPVRLWVDRATVRRGDSVTVTVQVPAASRATLWTRGPGEPWRAASLALDSVGRAVRRIGPLEADVFLRASSGGRSSAERRVTVALPAFVAALELTARYPAYLARPDEPLVPGGDTIPVPEGTVIVTSGAASVPLATVAWRPGGAVSRLQVGGWRVSRTGKVGDGVREPLDVSGVGDRAIVQGELDAARRGLLPGDTLRLRVEAWDNAPAPHVGRSAEIALRLPSLEEVRAALRAATRGLVETADSIAGSQRDLGERTGDLAQQRSRDETAGGGRRPPPGVQPGTLPFQATERAQAVAHEQEALEQRVQE